MKKEKAAKRRKMSKEKSRASIILGIISAVFIALTVILIFVFRKYLSDAEAIRAFIEKNYFVGALVMILVCAVQVIVALVPGELVEIASGYAFGAWWGALICLIGIMLGSVIVLLLVHKFGRKFVYVFYPKEKIDNIKWLSDPKKRNALTAVIFLIPGTPKDLLTYAIGLTDMKISTYIMLTTVARFPSLISSTLGGNAVGEQDYTAAVWIFAITAVVSGAGLLLYNFISKKKSQAHEEKVSESEKDD